MLLLKWLCTRFVSAIKKLKSRNHSVHVRRPQSAIVGEGKEGFIIRALNGMNTRHQRHFDRVTSWAAVHQQPVRYTYSPTGGFIKDTFGVIAIKQGRKSRTALHVKEQLIKDLNTGKNVVFVAHSRGTIQAEKALRSIYKERPDLLERLYVIGVGGARRIGTHLGKYVLNIVATNDPIANLAEKRKRYRYNVLSVESPESMQFDHSLEGSTYKSAVHEVIDRLGKLALSLK